MVDHTGRPKYVEVADALRRAITDGTYPIGSELPSTSRLTESFGVSTTVVRAAVRELQTEGLVVGQPGKAVYVRAEPAADRNAGVEERLAALESFVRSELARLDERVVKLEAERPS